MKKNKKIITIIILLLLTILSTYYTYKIRPIVDDELYNFGFSKSILEGRIPYLDFNMIIPPIFPYILSIFLKIFGKKLIIYHILLSILIVSATYISSKKIGPRAIAIYSLMLIYPFIGYNTLCLLLLFILINLNNKKNKDILESIIISIMFLTKQTLGILIIPNIIYGKNKKKQIIIYICSILSLLTYLLINKNLYNFIDYCFLGMLNFTQKNSNISPLLFIELGIIITLSIIAIKTKKKEYYYILLFQIISLPTVDYAHFFTAFIPILYLLIIKLKNNFIGNIFITTFSISFLIIFTISIYKGMDNYKFLSHYKENTFMKGRLTYTATSNYISNIESYLKEYSEYKPYLLGNFSYLVKLNLNIPITKYDIINNGNMGYHGYKQYIKEINKDCKKQKCIFMINDQEADGTLKNQCNRELLQYIQKKYNKKYSSSIFSIYITNAQQQDEDSD